MSPESEFQDEEPHRTGRTSGVFQAQHDLSDRVGSLEDSRRNFRWIFGLCLPALFIIALWLIDKVQVASERAGETSATIRSLERTIGALDMDVRELRARILKLSLVEPAPGVVATGSP